MMILPLLRILVLATFLAAVSCNTNTSCPVNITAELKLTQFMYSQCYSTSTSSSSSSSSGGSNNATWASAWFNCCVGIYSIVRMLTFSWLHSSHMFTLPDLRTATVCVDAFEQALYDQGVQGAVEERLLQRCGIVPSDLVEEGAKCHGITNISTFQRLVDVAPMNKACASNGFACGDCLRSMATAFQSLDWAPANSSSACSQFIMMYVAAVVNDYRTLGTDVISCLISVPDLRDVKLNVGEGGGRNLGILVGAPVAASAAAVAAVAVVWYCHSRRHRRRVRETMHSYRLMCETTGLTLYSLGELRACTDGFSEGRMVGEGGSGQVYEGMVSDGSRVAVKRFRTCTGRRAAVQYAELFSQEMQVISGVKHRNLLPLRGFCLHMDPATGGIREQLLVYDFMPHGSLADNLFSHHSRHGGASCKLSWEQRYGIAVGIARGLAYLHEHVKPTIIHRDVKAANVLLDRNLEPRVVDFGLAMLKREVDPSDAAAGPEDSFRTNPARQERTVGTLGYLAPEYALYGHVSEKSDVFSFGIVLLELVTGRRALSSTSGVLEHFLISDWVADMVHSGRLHDVVDEAVRAEYAVCADVKMNAERVLLLGLQCAHPRAKSRPSMPEALLALQAMQQHPNLPQQMEYFLESDKNMVASLHTRGDLTWDLDRHSSRVNFHSSDADVTDDSFQQASQQSFDV